MITKKTTLFLSLFIAFALLISFSLIYFNDQAWGAWGDDSPGYIFLAGRLYQGLPLVYHDDLVKAGYDFFQDEKLSRWLTPTHHFLINQQGTIASKYPLGLSLLMVGAAKFLHNSEGFYALVPLSAALNLVLFYLVILKLIPANRYRQIIGALSAVGMGLSSLYYDYAIAQPMREIPSMTFLLISALCILFGVEYFKAQKKIISLSLMGLFGIAFGFAFSIRETSAVILPAFFLFAVFACWHNSQNFKENLKKLWPAVLVVLIGLFIGLMPTFWNAKILSAEKEVFKQRDTSQTVILPNIGHLESFSLQNLFNSHGKYRPDSGSFSHYFAVLKTAVPIPYFLVLVIIGFIFFFKESRPKAVLLILWILGTLTIFSLWVNPYSRYILPLFPPFFFLGVYGLFAFMQKILPRVLPHKLWQWLVGIAVLATVVAAYQPVIVEAQENMRADIYKFKAISYQDLQNLTELGNFLQERYQNPVLLFSGEWQYGISETLQAHTNLKTIRAPWEQGKFSFNNQKIDQFFTRKVLPKYDLLVWTDATTQPATLAWLAKYTYQEVASYNFSFQPDVKI